MVRLWACNDKRYLTNLEKKGNYLNFDLKLSQAERDDAGDGGKSEAVKGGARGGLGAFRFHSIGDKDEVEQ